MRMGSTNRADRETIIGAYTSFTDGNVVESRGFLGRDFLIEDERPDFEWKLTSETAEFLGYQVLKATAVQDSSSIEAWFTPQIPISGGPGPYGGLPGMILVVSVDDGRMQYSANEIVMTAVAEDVIVPPTEGDRVTRGEYEKMVAEKLEELRMTRGGRG
jgi:GLPGLI family protein